MASSSTCTNGTRKMTMTLRWLVSLFLLCFHASGNIVSVVDSCGQCLLDCGASCTGGEFYNNGSCTPCPAGYKCPGSIAQPQTCPSGQFSGNGSSQCTTCPSGHSCSDPSQSPSPCLAGTYSLAGSSQCNACPEGSYSLEGQAGCLECPPGHFCHNGSIFFAPTPCNAGDFSSGGVSLCMPCAAGWYSGGGAEVCLSCPPGHYCPPGSSSPLPCLPGEWSSEQASSCDLCPAGYSCLNAGGTPSPCQPGEWSPLGNSSCMVCPAGASCLNPTLPPVLCELGHYSTQGDPHCHLCPAGFNCSNEGGLFLCPEGHYSPPGSTDCTLCPVGHACPLPFLSPILCAGGQHTEGSTGSLMCSDCPSGHFCPNLSLPPQPCPNGTYSAEASTSCSVCPPGYQCPTTAGPSLPCLPGFQSVAGSTECSPCPAGFGCPLTSDPSLNFACVPGSFSSEGVSVCSSCPAGSACPNTSASVLCESGSFSLDGYTECEPCPAGWACPYTTGHGNAPCTRGSYSSGNATSCTVCPAGSYCPSTNLALPLPCPQGTYAEQGQTSCSPCPPGYSCALTTAPPTDLCTSGTYSPLGESICQPCPPGWACPSTMTSDDIITCAPGTYSLEMWIRCEVCPAGSHCPNTTSSPLPCPMGHYSTEGALSCTPCPPGFSCAISNALPTICDVGTYSPGGSDSCLPCNPGYMCEQGSTAANLSTAVCPQGFYCADGASQMPCPAGSYGNKTGLMQISECLLCVPGFYCPQGTSGYPTASLQCPQGHYCPSGTTTRFEFPCADGTYSIVFGLERADQCLSCPAGRFCSGGDAIGGQLCPRGNYCPVNSMTPTACPGGTYTEAEGSYELALCQECPAGFYCTSGTDSPTPCSAGTYNPLLGQNSVNDCQPCPAGQACSTIALTQPNELCSPGHFCPEGSDRSADPANMCLAGTFTDYRNLTVADECSVCPAGWACPAGTGGISSPRLACAMGHYCPNGTQFTTQFPCAAGSYGNSTRLQRQVECEVCPAGEYCVGGTNTPSGPCGPGHYCPAGTRSPTEFPCPAGSFFDLTGNIRIQNCLQCTSGHYCPSGSVLPTSCTNGTFSTILGAADVSTCVSCPGGYHCPTTAVETPLPCGIGLFSDVGGISCTVCSPGYYCDNCTTSLTDLHANKICPAGISCAAGGFTHPPNLLINACPSGHYCLPGDIDPFPIPCPNGTFTPLTGQKSVSQCSPCPRGKYCSPEGRIQPAGNCAPGHYCPLATRYPDEFPCPTSTFLSNASAESLDACTTCISGSYCPQPGLAIPVICPQGFYCVTGSHTPQPCPPGTYGNSTGLRRSQECLPCPGGQYCDGFGLPQPTGFCDAGFFCRARASVSAPTDGITGDVCPRGGFCPQGSAIQANCPVGTYGNSTGNRGPEDCIICDPGFFCSGDNNPSPTGLCAEGCYCPGGANSSCQVSTPPGSFSIAGQAAPTLCLEGTYQPASRQSSCPPCLPGLYCNETGLQLGLPCPPGSYCPLGSIQPTPCPRGTFSDTDGLFNVSSCDPCTPGSYCMSEGLTTPTGFCDPGHYCLAGAELPNPGFAGELYGNVCPPGHYCLSGTTSPTEFPCPLGTFNPSDGAPSLAHCLPCTPGDVCSQFALSSPNEGCAPGHFCTANATHSNPVGEVWGDLCPIGHTCPGNTSNPILCSEGSFVNHTGAIQCTPCPEGSYCINGAMVLDCPPGYQCPQGTGLNWTACMPGTYNPSPRGSCIPCPGGRYCAGFAIRDFSGMDSGDCAPGYFCLEGIATPTPTPPLSSGVGGECPQGFYCPTATHTPFPCPLGTFSNTLQLTNEGDCLNCTSGSYCGETNLTAPSGNCDAGFVCTEGAAVPNPDGSDSSGFPCPAGNFCPNGSFTPMPCNAGEYNPLEGQAVCFPCPRGFYCPQGAVEFNSTICPMGHYCPERTTHPFQFPCPPGTYRASIGAQALEDCTPCEPGQYCTGAQSSPDGFCDPGWFCIRGASSPQPFDTGMISNNSQQCYCPNMTVGGQCEPGFFCPGGSNSPNPCPAGMYCDGFRLIAPTSVCQQGFYCLSAASVPNPSDGVTGFPCPLGHYCESGVITPTPCPMGTYLNTSGSNNITDCIPCTGGSYCGSEGLPLPSGPCSPGYFCPEGSIVPNDARYLCNPGHSCPEGSLNEAICEGGSYQPNPGEANCTVCPEGFYCPFNASNPLTVFFDCPKGFYCPQGTHTATQFPCPPGTFSSLANRISLSDCLPCPSGRFCATNGIATSSGSGPCLAGYFCILGASLPNPTDNATGNICPSGHYCPEGSTEPMQCSAGSFSPNNGSTAAADCLPCSPGEYCELPALSQPTGSCDPGYFCVSGSTTPTPTDGVLGNFCDPGSFCPRSSNLPIPCQPGSFTSEILANNCSVCPQGFYCTNTSSVPLLCPSGYYCPEGTGFDWLPCPAGTFSDTLGLGNINECTQCTGGFHCSSAAAAAVTGPCQPGYFCTSGSDSPTPDGLTNMGTAGPCPQGSFCPQQTTTPFPCPPGTFSNSTQLLTESECLLCTPGSFCEGYGLTIPTGPCSSGYFCTLGSSVAAPLTNDSIGGVCPIAHFCPLGSPVPLQCEPGTYNPIIGQGQCLPCPSGFFCTGNSTEVDLVCPVGHYCPTGTSFPSPCPAGTLSDLTGRSNLTDCRPCPAGQYCGQSGLSVPSGPCSGGWYCTLGSPTPQPNDTLVGGRCPPGFYCPNASSSPLPCLAGHYCDGVGLSDVSGPCSAGHFCTGGADTPSPRDGFTGDLCLCGHYCPLGTGTPQPCPLGFYTNITGNMAPSDCMPCDAGAYCQTEGLCAPTGPCAAGHYCPSGQNSSEPIDYVCIVGHSCPEGSAMPIPCLPGLFQDMIGQSVCQPCPPGHYCVGGTIFPSPCPPGTLRNQTNGASESDCDLCIGGYYCPTRNCQAETNGTFANTTLLESDFMFADNISSMCDVNFTCPSTCMCSSNVTIDSNIHGIPCSAGTHCPPGSPVPLVCPGGHICGDRSSQPTPCSAGYHCMPGSQIQMLCSHPFYCPSVSAVPLTCPSGHLARNVSTRIDTLRTSIDDSCFACQPGFFSDDGQDCYECPARYYCPVLTSNPLDFPCPVGSYCPSGSAMPTLCPAGSYNGQTLGQNETQCLQCPVNTFSSLPGAAACQICGSSAVSVETRTTCQCMGARRTFSPSFGTCICDGGYTFFNEAGMSEPEADGTLDCLAIVDQRCSGSQSRRADTRECVDPFTFSCDNLCRFQGGGLFNVNLGICECSQLVDPLALCTGECLNCRPDTIIRRSQNSTLVYAVRDCNGTVLSEQEVTGVLGVNLLDSTNRRLQLVTHSGEGQVVGAFPTTNAEAIVQLSPPTTRRRRATTPSSGITNPVLCLETGEAVVFQITQSSNGSYHYPMYIKDHLLNTNPQFDFGSFSQLNTLIQSTVDLSTFVHIFNTPGTYIFADSLTAGSMTAVMVIELGTSCVRDGQDFRVFPISAATLNRFGVTRVPITNQEPDFAAIFGILATTLFIVIVLVLLMFIWKPQAAGIKTPRDFQPVYRRVDQPKVVYLSRDSGLDSLEKRGIGVGATASVTNTQENFLLENFNVRTLYDKLEDQSLHVSAQLSRQQSDLRAFYDKVIQQVEGLKGLLSETSVLATVEASGTFVQQNLEERPRQERLEPVGAEQPTETSFIASLSDEQENMLVGLLRDLLTKAGYKGHQKGVGTKKTARREEMLAAVESMQELESQQAVEVQTASEQLSERLSRAKGQEEVDHLLEEHSENMALLTARHERERRQQREELKKKLKARRNKKMTGQQSEEEMLITHQQQISQTVSKDLVEECRREAQQLIRTQKEVSNEMEGLLCSTLERGGLAIPTTKELMAQLAVIKDTREWQLTLVRGRMEQKTRQRKERLHSKHKKQRLEFEDTLTGGVESGTLTEAEKANKLSSLNSQQQLEADTLMRQLSTEETITMAALTQQTAKISADKEIQCGLEVIRKRGEASEKSGEEVEKMCMEFKGRTEAILSRMESKRRVQTARLKTRQSIRRQKKLAELVDDVIVDSRSPDSVFVPIVQLEPSMEEKVLVEQQEQARTELKASQETERTELSLIIEKEAANEEGQLLKTLEEGKQKAMNERKQRLMAKLEGGVHSQEQREQLLAAHKAELEGLERRLDVERDRQLIALRDKLGARRGQRLEEQKRKQELALQKELLEQKKELQHVQNQQVKEAESKAIVEGIKNNSKDTADIVIRKVLEQRQKRELEQLEANLQSEKEQLISAALLDYQTSHNRAKEELDARLKRELAEAGDETNHERLLNTHGEQLAELERRSEKERATAESSLTADIEARHAKARLELRERHYQEYLSALTELAPDSQKLRQSMETASSTAKELEEVKGQLEADKARRESQLQCERESFEAAQNALLKEQLSAFELELAAEEETEKEKVQQSMAALQEERNKILSDRKEKIKERVTNFGGDEQEKLLQSHNEDTQKLVNKIDAQRLRMQADLQERIRQRRKGKMKSKELAIQQEMLAERKKMEEKEMLERKKLAEEQKAKLESLQHEIEASMSVPEVAIEPEEHAEPYSEPSALPLSQEEITRLILATPLYQRLEQIKLVLSRGTLVQTEEGYIDPLDSQWTKDTELHTVDLNTLSPRHFVVYQFACSVLRSLESVYGYQPVILLIADHIPPNYSYSHNSFRNSFAFDSNNRILYMRLERLENVGEFTLVLVHTLAHIKSGSFESDSRHSFLREFHRALSLICSDLFLGKFKEDSSAASNFFTEHGKGSPNSLKSTFNSARSIADKKNMVDELLDTRIMTSIDIHGEKFTHEGVIERLQQYAEFQLGSKLRSYLDELEADKRDNWSPPGSGRPERTTQSLNPREKWRSVLKRLSKKRHTQDKQQYQQLLSIQISHLEQRVSEIDGEYHKAVEERRVAEENIRQLETQLTNGQLILQKLDEKSTEYEAKKGELKKIGTKLSAARTEQATFDLRINGCLKRLEGFRVQLKQKTDELKDYEHL